MTTRARIATVLVFLAVILLALDWKIDHSTPAPEGPVVQLGPRVLP